MATTRTAKKPAKGAGQKAEFDTLKRRATSLAKNLTAASFDKDGNAVGDWAMLLASLDEWAKRYKVKFRMREVESGGGAPAAGGATPRTHTVCPGSTSSTERTDFVGGGHITIRNTCTLRRTTLLGRCVYSCVGEIVDWTS